jgi:DNA polymerase-1
MGRYDDPLDQWLIGQGYTDRGKPDLGYLWLAPDEIVQYYNGCDSDATLRLKHFLAARLEEAGLTPTFYSERMPLVRLYQEVDRQGVRINRPYLDELSTFLGDALEKLRIELAEYAEDPEFNPSSHKQVADLFFEKIGLPILGRTDAGAPSTREEILKQLEEAHPAVPTLLTYRAHEKIKGTYVDGKDTVAGQKKALRAVIDDDGYARMNTFISLAETFRFITRKPFPIHTWPKRDPKTGIPSVRALIIPDEDSVFCIRDYVQQEWAIAALLAGQKDMIEAILDRGEDVHEMVTRDLGGAPKESFLDPLGAFRDPEKGHLVWRDRIAYDTYKKLRQDWKSTNFAILFRAGAKKLAKMAFGCTGDVRSSTLCKKEKVVACSCEDRAAQYIANYYERFEEIRWWQYNVIKDLQRTGMVSERFGTYRKLPAINDPNYLLRLEAERQGCNFPVQRGGVAVMIRAMLRLDVRLKKEKLPGRIVFSMHDEMIGQFRRDVAEEGMYLMKWAMEAPYRELDGRSLRTDGAVVDCWGG